MINSIVCIFFYLLSIICTLVLAVFIKKHSLPKNINNQFPSLFCYFAAGMICFFNLNFILQKGKFLIIPCILVSVSYFIFKCDFLFPLFPMALAISLIFIGFKITAFNKMKDFSYGMYLVHFPIINILSFTNIFQLHPIMGLLFAIGMSFAYAYILEKIVSIKIPKQKTIKIISEVK